MSITSQIEVQDTDVKCIEVEEWLLNGEPLKIFFTPMTVKDQKKIGQRHPNFHENLFDAEVQMHIIIPKALDEKGDQLFDFGDKNWLSQRESSVVLRVAAAIMQGKTIEELEKN